MVRVRGFTLVELMIALTLGALLLGAAIELLVSSQRVYRLADDLSRIQENGIAAIDLLEEDIRYAGYTPAHHPAVAVLPRNCVRNQASTASPCPGRGPGTNDLFSVQYVASSARQYDCTGQQLHAKSVVINHYRIADIDGDGIRSLYCQGYSVSGATFLSGPVPLVDGIDAMQVLYRVYYPAHNRYAYRSFEQLHPQDIDHITAITVALLVNNGLRTGNADKRTRHYRLLDATVLTRPADAHVRRLFRTTIALNNQNPGVPL